MDKPILKDEKTGRFLTGNNGGGRTKGARNRLGEEFVGDLYAAWQEHGRKALETSATKEPAQFCKLVSNLLPREVVTAQLTATAVHLFKDKADYIDPQEFAAAYSLALSMIGSSFRTPRDQSQRWLCGRLAYRDRNRDRRMTKTVEPPKEVDPYQEFPTIASLLAFSYASEGED